MGGGILVVWTGISTNHRTDLHIFNNNVNAANYLNEVLQNHVQAMFARNQELQTFQQDNARPHTAGICQQFLQTQNFAVLPWPPYSPDLSPIEHIWDVLGQRVQTNHDVQNLAQLRNALVQEWNAIPQATIASCTRSMRRKIRACLQAGGGHTRY